MQALFCAKEDELAREELSRRHVLVQTRREDLDREYLERHAARSGITDLLARLLASSCEHRRVLVRRGIITLVELICR
jgi:hypothetical protein